MNSKPSAGGIKNDKWKLSNDKWKMITLLAQHLLAANLVLPKLDA